MSKACSIANLWSYLNLLLEGEVRGTAPNSKKELRYFLLTMVQDSNLLYKTFKMNRN